MPFVIERVRILAAAVCAVGFLGAISCVSAQDQDEPIQINASPERMRWWNDQRFGLFIHWGPLDDPIVPIWSSAMTVEEKNKAYAEVYENFNPVKYDADEWAKLAKDAGARYVVLTTKHTVFYSMALWDTKTCDHSVTNPACPYSRRDNPDIVDQYVKALRKEGLGVGLYYTHGDRWHPDARIDESHKDGHIADFDKKFPDRWANFLQFERDQLRELLTNYGTIDMLWFDGWYKNDVDGLPLLKMMREVQPDMIVNDRGTGLYGDYVTPEDCVPSMQIGDDWESCLTLASPATWISPLQQDRKLYMSLQNNWWYLGEDPVTKSPTELVQVLCTVASKGGNLLLNVGPRPDGSIVEKEAAILREIGDWLHVNGEGIYGTTGSPLNRVPYWGRVTTKGQSLYLHVFDWPKRGQPLKLSLANDVKSVRLLATDEEVTCRRVDSTTVELYLPVSAPSLHVSTVVVEVDGEISRLTGMDPFSPNADGEIVLRSRDAAIFGVPMRTFWEILQHEGKSNALINWRDPNSYPQWGVYSPEAKEYDVEIIYRTTDESTNDAFAIEVTNNRLEGKTVFTDGQFKSFSVGTITLPEGRSNLTVKCLESGMRYYNMDLRQITLTPVSQ